MEIYYINSAACFNRYQKTVVLLVQYIESELDKFQILNRWHTAVLHYQFVTIFLRSDCSLSGLLELFVQFCWWAFCVFKWSVRTVPAFWTPWLFRPVVNFCSRIVDIQQMELLRYLTNGRLLFHDLITFGSWTMNHGFLSLNKNGILLWSKTTIEDLRSWQYTRQSYEDEDSR